MDTSDEEYDAESYCTRVSAALEASLTFGSSDLEDQGAGRRGGAETYSTFYVDSCEEDLFSDDYEFTDLRCQVSQSPDPSPLQQATPTNHDTAASAAGAVSGLGTRSTKDELVHVNSDEGDDGWNSDPEDVLPLATSSSGELFLLLSLVSPDGDAAII